MMIRLPMTPYMCGVTGEDISGLEKFEGKWLFTRNIKVHPYNRHSVIVSAIARCGPRQMVRLGLCSDQRRRAGSRRI
jgi:hypothetical protein